MKKNNPVRTFFFLVLGIFMLFQTSQAVIVINNIEAFLEKNSLDLATQWHNTVSPLFDYATDDIIYFPPQAYGPASKLGCKINKVFTKYVQKLRQTGDLSISSLDELAQALQKHNLISAVQNSQVCVVKNIYELFSSQEIQDKHLKFNENSSVHLSSVIEEIGTIAGSYLNRQAIRKRFKQKDESIFDCPLMPMVIDWSTKNACVTITGAPGRRQDISFVADGEDDYEDSHEKLSVIKTLKTLFFAYLAAFMPPLTPLIKKSPEDQFSNGLQEICLKYTENQNK